MDLAGELVRLRPLGEDELDDLVRLDRERPAQFGGPRPVERLRQKIAGSGHFVGGRLELALEVDGRMAGTIQARAPEGAAPPGVCELGIEVAGELRGRGIGTEAVELLTAYLHRNGYPRVQASTDVANSAMRRSLEKAGFELEGVMRGFMPDGDGRADYALYARTAG